MRPAMSLLGAMVLAWSPAAAAPPANLAPVDLVWSGSAEIVDAVPVGGGIINNNLAPGFDSSGRVLIAHREYDAQGGTQVHVASRGDQFAQPGSVRPSLIG